MKEYIIKIKIDVDGTLKSETFGMQGEVCVEELDNVLAQVKGRREIENTDDYYKKSSDTETEIEGN